MFKYTVTNLENIIIELSHFGDENYVKCVIYFTLLSRQSEAQKQY